MRYSINDLLKVFVINYLCRHYSTKSALSNLFKDLLGNAMVSFLIHLHLSSAFVVKFPLVLHTYFSVAEYPKAQWPEKQSFIIVSHLWSRWSLSRLAQLDGCTFYGIC